MTQSTDATSIHDKFNILHRDLFARAEKLNDNQLKWFADEVDILHHSLMDYVENVGVALEPSGKEPQ